MIRSMWTPANVLYVVTSGRSQKSRVLIIVLMILLILPSP
jgi:hypothetical protein